jgi:ribosomal protein S27E
MALCSPPSIDGEQIPMILKISCPSCHHVGLVAADTLPRDLTCSACGDRHHVDASDGKAIVSTDRFEEYLSGERERPQVRRKAASLSSL